MRRALFIYLFLFLSFNAFSDGHALKSKPVINLAMAKVMADACEADQRKSGYSPINIAIVDDGGDLVLFRRQNDAFLLSIDIAMKKANSSAGIPFPTRTIEELVYGKDGKPGIIPGLAFSKDLVAFAGGLPIRTKSGVLLGAIGVSGATADEDEQCAAAAIKAVDDIL
ncbi:MAG: cobalamin adenosyltransferase [Rickettsiales bacterium]|nr:cobalamin adenosyltransferase [Rickettsiales bacterium]